MGKVKSGARKPPAKPKQRRKRQINAEHETGSPSGVDTRHALLTAISTRGCVLRFAAYFQPVNKMPLIGIHEMLNVAPPHDVFRRYLKTILPSNKIKFRDTVFRLFL